jgi:hypothetical protein
MVLKVWFVNCYDDSAKSLMGDKQLLVTVFQWSLDRLMTIRRVN